MRINKKFKKKAYKKRFYKWITELFKLLDETIKVFVLHKINIRLLYFIVWKQYTAVILYRNHGVHGGLLDYVLWIIYDTITEHAIIVINLKINYQKYKIYFKMQPTCLSYRIKIRNDWSSISKHAICRGHNVGPPW